MTPEQGAVFFDLLVMVISYAPIPIVLMYLIYRQEVKEQKIIDVLLEISIKCCGEEESD